ncbi:hypothetical protein Pelo_10465 [Pelomyxa schiedti]|nr:hypothetical protein Pelo_10465 [Pelomyxa schiedti]
MKKGNKKEVDKVYGEADRHIKDANKTTDKMIAQMNDCSRVSTSTSRQLHQQGEQLDRISSTVYSVEDELSVADRTARQMMILPQISLTPGQHQPVPPTTKTATSSAKPRSRSPSPITKHNIPLTPSSASSVASSTTAQTGSGKTAPPSQLPATTGARHQRQLENLQRADAELDDKLSLLHNLVRDMHQVSEDQHRELVSQHNKISTIEKQVDHANAHIKKTTDTTTKLL